MSGRSGPRWQSSVRSRARRSRSDGSSASWEQVLGRVSHDPFRSFRLDHAAATSGTSLLAGATHLLKMRLNAVSDLHGTSGMAGRHIEPGHCPQERSIGALEDIAVRRERQVMVEKSTPEHDDGCMLGDPGLAAMAHIANSLLEPSEVTVPGCWTWGRTCFTPEHHREDLVHHGPSSSLRSSVWIGLRRPRRVTEAVPRVVTGPARPPIGLDRPHSPSSKKGAKPIDARTNCGRLTEAMITPSPSRRRVTRTVLELQWASAPCGRPVYGPLQALPQSPTTAI